MGGIATRVERDRSPLNHSARFATFLQVPARLGRSLIPAADPEARLDLVLAICAFGLGLFSFCTLVAVAYLHYTPLPLFDGWDHWIGFLNTDDPLTFLFRQHNEHRIPVSRVLFFIDQRWFHGDTRFLLWCMFAAQVGSALVLYRLASWSTLAAAHRVQLLGLILAFTFAASQWNNFTWSFQVCFVIVFFAGLCAFAALSRTNQGSRERSVSWAWVIASIVMGLTATGSMANGLLVWPLMVLMAFCIGLPMRVSGVLTAVGVVVTCLYIRGYQSGGFVVADSLMKTPEILAFALAYLGSAVDEPFVAITRAVGLDWTAYRIPVSALVGLVGVLCALWFAVVAICQSPRRSTSGIAMLHILAFLVASATLTALGRLRFGIGDALTSRYATPSVLFWACLTGCALSPSVRPSVAASRRAGRTLRMAALGVAAIAGGLIQLPKVAYAIEAAGFLSEGEHAIVNRLFAAEAWERFFPTPGRMIPVVRYFRANHLASFSREWTDWMGEPVRAHFIMSSTASDCIGEWESVSTIGGSFNPAVFGTGWGYDRRFGTAPRRVVFADGNGRIVGFAAATRRRPDLAPRHPEVSGVRVGWVSFLPASISSDLTAYLLLADGRTLCRSGSASIRGNYFTADAAKAGDIIAGVEVITADGWVNNDRKIDVSHPPFGGDTWSSGAADGGTATLRLGPITTRAGHTVGLPLRIGPGASRVHVYARQRATGEVLAAANPPTGKSEWHFWRLDVPAGAPEMVFDYVVEHVSSGAGDWIFVGQPRMINP